MQIINELKARPALHPIKDVNLILKNPESLFVALTTKLTNTKKQVKPHRQEAVK